ncbi:hypothetical protein M0812_01522 [Anaeramoeba flamelloides]|uniref:RRM domain-containing protein n=1 Tax=Anaeramoeba flamelloides TaxID=1746091 RepID=A0AAV8A410_9EUKA|nr:hypothetical protein M0812_01522 [Anaeramoeba flamelloides]
MNNDKIQKIFLKNLPSKYSIDKLVALIEDKTNCSPNIGIIKNKKNPNNGLFIITPLSKENEAIIKQNLCDNFYFEQRQILVSEYDKEYKYKKKLFTKKKRKKNKNKKTTQLITKTKGNQNFRKMKIIPKTDTLKALKPTTQKKKR